MRNFLILFITCKTYKAVNNKNKKKKFFTNYFLPIFVSSMIFTYNRNLSR